MEYVIENQTVHSIERIGSAKIKANIGSEKRIELISENNTEKIYQWQKFDLEKGEYVVDEENIEPAEIEGKEYSVNNGKIVVPKELSKSEVKIKEFEEVINTLGKQLAKEKIENMKKDKIISELGKQESKLSMDLIRMKNEVNTIKQVLDNNKKGGE